EIMAKVAEESIARMETKGANYSTIDTQPFVERMSGLYQQWEKEGKLPKGFLEEVAALAN
ncbi:MAG: hypothetical protein V2I56_16740, partial [Desulfobacteraceae bacterium]|nr:hypothetical protein [Desulfobacteraceae bacterium]